MALSDSADLETAATQRRNRQGQGDDGHGEPRDGICPQPRQSVALAPDGDQFGRERGGAVNRGAGRGEGGECRDVPYLAANIPEVG